MAEQLTILGLWERSAPGEVVEDPPLTPAPPPPPPDPRQHDLLSGPHLLRFKIEEACIALDPEAVRAAHANLLAHSIGEKWGDWAEDVGWLVEPTAGEESAHRALSLSTGVRFPGAPRFLREKVRAAALGRAMQQLISAGGPAAALPDGRPAGYLALVSGDFALARSLLTEACDATANSNASWLGYLGEASWRVHESFAAMQCWCRASLIDPSQIDLEWVSAPPVLELLDLHDELELSELPLSYLAVLADLLGKHPLDDFALEVPAEASTPRRLAALLRAYRHSRPASEGERIEAKRVLARLAPPGLRELLRRL